MNLHSQWKYNYFLERGRSGPLIERSRRPQATPLPRVYITLMHALLPANFPRFSFHFPAFIRAIQVRHGSVGILVPMPLTTRCHPESVHPSNGLKVSIHRTVSPIRETSEFQMMFAANIVNHVNYLQ
jgi:hypothetical protein